jgi:regulator of sigma E protease
VLSGVSTVLLAIAAGIVVLGVLIFVHELGHFLAAKSVGIAVHRFSFGLGPVTPLRMQRGETEYCVSWVPFGGYVKMAGLEDEPLEGAAAPPTAPERTFDAKPLWARVWVISAGVLMNALFGVAVYAGLAAAAGVAEDRTVTVGEVDTLRLPMGAAPVATLRPGDRIIRINGDTMRTWTDIQRALLTTAQSPIRIEVAFRAEPVLADVPVGEQEARMALVRAVVPWHQPVLGTVFPGQPAAVAGLRSGDKILRVNGDTVLSWERLVRVIQASAERALNLTVQRGTEFLAVQVTPQPRTERTAGGEARTVGKIGASPMIEHRRFGVVGALGEGVRQAASAAGLVLFTLKGIVLGQLSPRDIGGPIFITQLSGEVARMGIEPFLSFMALFSVNLAVLNLLPIPVLDGGHLVFLAIEGVRRRPLSVAQRQRLTQLGLFVLFGLMILAVVNDVGRLIR